MKLIKKKWEFFGWECSKPNLSHLEFNGVSSDSRSFAKDQVFFAYDGLSNKGKDFIPAVGKKNPKAVFAPQKYRKELLQQGFEFPVFFSKNFLDASIQIISHLYSHPSRKLILVGITGTNGKSSISFFLHELFKSLKKESMYIGTLGACFKNKNSSLKNTTPDLITLSGLLNEAVNAGVKYAFMEVSSHALDQDRVKGLDFSAGVFSNLTQDHLDYHKDMDHYFEAKKKLFKNILKQKQEKNISAIGFAIYIDDPYGMKLYRWLKTRTKHLKVLSLGRAGNCDLQLLEIKNTREGVKASFSFEGKVYFLRSGLIGSINMINILMALLVGFLLGLPFKKMLPAAEKLKAVRGRMEVVYRKKDSMIIIDYAHTPNALEKILQSLQEILFSRIILIFGCGGNRDKAKRSKMGEVASRFADIIILTNDNPRREDPVRIIKDIEKGIKNKMTHVIPDRRKAIRKGIQMFKAGDLLLVAGKGHENYQTIGMETKSFSDHTVIKEEIKKFMR